MSISRKHHPKYAYSRNGFHSTFTCAKVAGLDPDKFRKWAKKHGVANMMTKNPDGHGRARIWKLSDVRRLSHAKSPVQETLDFDKESMVSNGSYSVELKELVRQIKENTGCTKVVLEF